VDHDGAGGLATCDGGAQRGGGELGGHAFVDGVADDPVGEQVLDRAAVELALGGGVLGDVGQPDLIGTLGGEVPAHQVVMDCWAGSSLAAPSLLGGGRPDPVVAAQPPHPSFAGAVTGALELIGNEPVAELGVIGVHVDDRVGQVGVVEITVTHRVGPPLVERLGREPEHPAGQPHRDPFGGQFLDQRVAHFGR
jgi:hypothetical protein